MISKLDVPDALPPTSCEIPAFARHVVNKKKHERAIRECRRPKTKLRPK